MKDSYEAKGIKLGLDKLQERFRPNKKQYNSSKNRINSELNDYELSTAIDKQLKSNILKGKGGSFSFEIKNTHRSIGARLQDYCKKIWRGWFSEKLILNFKGTAGQGFGCWI